MPAEFPLPPAQRSFLNPPFRRNSLLSLSFGRMVDRERLRAGWEALVRIHPVLRSSFQAGNLLEHEPAAIDAPGWQEPDWSGEEAEKIPALWQDLQEKAASDFLDAAAYPLWRVYLIKLPGGQSHLLTAFHPGLVDRPSASMLLIQWLNACEVEPAILQGLPVSPGLAVANASVDLGDAAGELWPEQWQGDCVLEILRPWFWLRPLGDTQESSATNQAVTSSSGVPVEIIEAIHARAESSAATAQEILTLLWAGFWALRSEVGGAFVGHPSELSAHLAPEHREIVGRLSPLAPFALVDAPPADAAWPESWWSAQSDRVRKSAAHIFAQPPIDLGETILGVGLDASDPCPGSAASWSEESINDLLHTRLPKWLGADARWTEVPALPLNLLVQGGRHPELKLIAHSRHLDQSACDALAGEFLLSAAKALGVKISGKSPATPLRNPAAEGSLFALSSDPGLARQLEEALGAGASNPVLMMGESVMTGADLLGCSNQLARFLRRAKLPDGTRYLVNLQPGNWQGLLLLTLVREGLPFLLCDEIIPPSQPPGWFEAEKIGCVFLDSTTAAEWEDAGVKTVVLDSAWDKVSALSDAPLQGKKTAGPAVWEFGGVEATGRTRLGEAVFTSSLSAAAGFWELKEGSRILSTASPGSPACLEEVLLACVSGAVLVHPGRDVFATRSAFQEALDGLQITHLALPAIRWSDWVHFLVELRQPIPASLERLLIRSGRIGVKCAAEWLRIAGADLVTTVGFSPFGLTAPGLGMPLREDVLPFLQAGLVPLGVPVGGVDVFACVVGKSDPLPQGSPGVLRMSLAANCGVDGVVPSEKSLELRGLVHASGLVCALNQPDIASASWKRPPAPVAAAAEGTLLRRPEIFDAFVARMESAEDGRRLQAWVVPQESGTGLPVGLAIWWKNESACAWTLEAAVSIPKCPILPGGALDAAALPAPTSLAFKPAKLPGSAKPGAAPGGGGETRAASEPAPKPAAWQINWNSQPAGQSNAIVVCGTLCGNHFSSSLAAAAGEDFAFASAPVPAPGQSLAEQGFAHVFCVASGAEAWDFLRWFNSLEDTQRAFVHPVLVQPAIVESAPGIDSQLKALWNRLLGRTAGGNARRDGVRGVRPVRCQYPLRVLCADEPETALTTYLPEAEFYAGDLESQQTTAAAVLDICNGAAG